MLGRQCEAQGNGFSSSLQSDARQHLLCGAWHVGESCAEDPCRGDKDRILNAGLRLISRPKYFIAARTEHGEIKSRSPCRPRPRNRPDPWRASCSPPLTLAVTARRRYAHAFGASYDMSDS